MRSYATSSSIEERSTSPPVWPPTGAIFTITTTLGLVGLLLWPARSIGSTGHLHCTSRGWHRHRTRPGVCRRPSLIGYLAFELDPRRVSRYPAYLACWPRCHSSSIGIAARAGGCPGRSGAPSLQELRRENPIDAHVVGENETGNETVSSTCFADCHGSNWDDEIVVAAAHPELWSRLIAGGRGFSLVPVSANPVRRLLYDIPRLASRHDVDLLCVTSPDR